MFTRDGILKLHGYAHQSLDVLLEHMRSVPHDRLPEPLAGFGKPTVLKQFAHILEVEEAWVGQLQYKPRIPWADKDSASLEVLERAKERVSGTTRAYLESLSEVQLNTPLSERPSAWVGELRSPAFILLHVVTHAFHHKGQTVAMLRMLGYPAPDTDIQRA